MSIEHEFAERFDHARPGNPLTLREIESAIEWEQSDFRDVFGPWPNMNDDEEYDYILNKVADRFGIDPDEL